MTPASRLSAAAVGRILGPAVFVLVLVLPMGSLEGAAKRVVAVVLWMAIWWVTEAAPLAITSMLPIAAGVAQRIEHPKAPSRLMLAVAYGASIGGIGTLAGTPLSDHDVCH